MPIRVLLPLFLTGVLLNADSVVMRNGNRVNGTFVGGDNRTIRIDVGGHVNVYNLNEVDSIQFNNGQASYSPNPNDPNSSSSYPYPSNSGYGGNTTGYQGNNSGPSSNYPAPNQSYAQGAGYNTLAVPSGTQVVVRLIDPVNSETDRLGQTYRASIDEDVMINGQTVIPRGADAVASLVDAQKSGKIEGRTALTLDLRSVTVNGRVVNVSTTGVSQASSSRGARSAKVIGGTAAVGAIIGAIAGGGKGAAIGAGSGAAVGTAAQVVTSGQQVKVPAETRLTFTLQNPLVL